MDYLSLSRRRGRWIAPVVVIAIGTIAFLAYLWHQGSRYNLPNLAPYVGAQEDLFSQIKCLTKLPQTGEPAKTVDPTCRFQKTYGGFWLTPQSLDTCLSYVGQNKATLIASSRLLEFDFVCEGKAMGANFSYQNGKYRLEQIGMLAP